MPSATRIPDSTTITKNVTIRLTPAPDSTPTGHLEPLRLGVPFARGELAEVTGLRLEDANGGEIPFRRRVLECWPDGSVRWLSIGFLARSAGAGCELRLRTAEPSTTGESTRSTTVECNAELDTGVARFALPSEYAAPFERVTLVGSSSPVVTRSTVEIEDEHGTIHVPVIDEVTRQLDGVEGTTLRARGNFSARRGRPLASFAARTTIVPGTGLVRFDLTVCNPRPARHKGGLWDLGDRGSILFRELRVSLELSSSVDGGVSWRALPTEEHRRLDGGSLSIHQESSGGEQWRSRNHVQRDGTIPLAFRGCRIRDGDHHESLDRASPSVRVVTSGGRLTAAIPRFWQEFPTSIRFEEGRLDLCFLPGEHGGLHELQGGERKTFTVYLLVDTETSPSELGDLTWVHAPTVPSVPPDRHAKAGAFDYFVPSEEDPHRHYVQLMGEAIEGADSFFAKRETIDEFGWRHFGDTPADHENRFHAGSKPVVSHYNNQYDLAHGLLLHFARTGDRRWFELARDLVAHVVDIDRYHTTGDRNRFNGGYFWHTDHYTDAGRGTHRTYTGDCPAAKSGKPYGGGPSNEHNYTSGLLQFHLMTGDSLAAEAVRELADWVISMDDGPTSILAPIDSGPTGIASCTFSEDYQGPGRGAGHSINALLDAHRLTGERRYLEKAEEIIRRCVHPRDDLDAANLLDPESRWSYVVFLQVVGKYLDRKLERDEVDEAFEYARATLLHYARWMAKNEVSFRSRFDQVDYPTETWPAQDVRKSCVFDLAAKYGPKDLRDTFTRKAAEFFEESLSGVSSFDTRTSTRPLAILLTSGAQRASFATRPPGQVPPPPETLDFGEPSRFVPQRSRVKRLIRSAGIFAALLRLSLQPRKTLRIVRALLR